MSNEVLIKELYNKFATLSMSLPPKVLSKYKTETFIETGTNEGGGCLTALECGFTDVRSVEAFEQLYDNAKLNLKDFENLKLFFGKSPEQLPNMLKGIDHKCTFWLDAHSDHSCPVLDEISAIGKHHIKNHIIMIDDIRMFNTPAHENVTQEQIKEAILLINPKYKFIYEDGFFYKDDILVCFIETPHSYTWAESGIYFSTKDKNDIEYFEDNNQTKTTNTDLYLHLPNGLGDQIFCNGIVRYFVDKSNNNFPFLFSGNVFVFCMPNSTQGNYMESIKFMYRDNENIKLITMETEHQILKYVVDNNLQNNTISHAMRMRGEIFLKRLEIGISWHDKFKYWNNETPHVSNSGNMDIRLYEVMCGDFGSRWNRFKVIRDSEREKKLFDSFNIDGEYIFIHDDERYRVDLNRININNRRIIRAEKGVTDIIFDYCSLIENASEVHTIESSFQWMIDSMSLNKENYVHRYARPLSFDEIPTYRSVKEILI